VTPKQECEELMNEVLPLAERMLRQYGEFYPYGGYVNDEGKVVHVGSREQGTDKPKSKSLIRILKDSFVEQAKHGICRATAIVYDVVVTAPMGGKKIDAIQVCLDHCDGYSAEVFQPYQLVEGRVILGETFAQEGKQEIFRR
jgi:uncharacterized protein YuzB (UPF0349 family)